MRAAIISDTHLPRGARALPATCLERLRAADLIVHAGDLTALTVLEQLREFAPVAAVHGNVDEPAVRAVLPAQLELKLGGLRIVVVHDAGRRAGRLQRLRARFPEANAVIFGHSHLPVLEVDSDGFQIFNPGSPTDRRRAAHHTMGLMTGRADGLSFELIELD